MNYRRIEIIFLVAFLCINVYLVSIWYDTTKDKVVSNPQVEKDIVTVLKEEDITYNFKLSNKHLESTYLSGEISDLFADQHLDQQKITNNQGMLVSNLNNPLVLDKNDEVQLLTEFKNNNQNVQYGRDYKYLKEASQSSKVICFAQYYDDLPIFDESAEVVFIKEKTKDQNDKIIGYKQQHIQNIQKMHEPEQLISQKEALSTLYNNSKLTKGMQINWMKLGYAKIYNEDKINIYVPTWLVSIKNANGVSQIEKVNAITDKIMSGSTSDLIN